MAVEVLAEHPVSTPTMTTVPTRVSALSTS
jgi:hypothetical protein